MRHCCIKFIYQIVAVLSNTQLWLGNVRNSALIVLLAHDCPEARELHTELAIVLPKSAPTGIQDCARARCVRGYLLLSCLSTTLGPQNVCAYVQDIPWNRKISTVRWAPIKNRASFCEFHRWKVGFCPDPCKREASLCNAQWKGWLPNRVSTGLAPFRVSSGRSPLKV